MCVGNHTYYQCVPVTNHQVVSGLYDHKPEIIKINLESSHSNDTDNHIILKKVYINPVDIDTKDVGMNTIPANVIEHDLRKALFSGDDVKSEINSSPVKKNGGSREKSNESFNNLSHKISDNKTMYESAAKVSISHLEMKDKTHKDWIEEHLFDRTSEPIEVKQDQFHEEDNKKAAKYSEFEVNKEALPESVVRNILNNESFNGTKSAYYVTPKSTPETTTESHIIIYDDSIRIDVSEEEVKSLDNKEFLSNSNGEVTSVNSQKESSESNEFANENLQIDNFTDDDEDISYVNINYAEKNFGNDENQNYFPGRNSQKNQLKFDIENGKHK